MRKLICGLIAPLLLAAVPLASQAGIFVSVTIAPPVLPVYVQPAIPGPGYIWTPGYWAWDGSYYWVPGTWVLAPVGLLWTPGYWGWVGGVYRWNAGYWGPHVGFYGGVNYGFGYGGVGFAGGEWRGGQMYYNRSVTNISTTNVTNVYNTTVVNNTTVNHTSFNGGSGGIAAQPNAAEIAASHEQHTPPIQAQTQNQTMAAHDNTMRASVNGGHPAVAATAHAGVFSGKGVVAARGATAGPAAHGVSPAQTHGGPYPQTHGNAFAPSHGSSAPPRGGFEQPRGAMPPQPQRGQARGAEPRGSPQREERQPQHQTRTSQSRPEQRTARASQARPQQHRTRGAEPQRQAHNAESGGEHRHS